MREAPISSNDEPDVFLCHAGEDNDRFAREFASRLQNQGFRVWFDEWELQPGDSLVDKVFEEGLKNAEAIVIVLSANSIYKPWVREEINAAFVKRIEGKCKLIPVVIDDVAIPEALKSTVYQRVRDLQNYEAELDRIVRAIVGDRNRPGAGELPGYAQTIALPGLYSTDTRVLQLAGEVALEQNHQLIESEEVLRRGEPDGITEEGLLESLQVLEEHGYVDIHATMGPGISGMSAFSVTLNGLDEYVRAFVPDYDATFERIVVQLVNASGSGSSDRALATEIDTSRLIVEHVLDILAARGLIKVTKMSGPNTAVDYVSPQLGRLLQEGS